jgi:hypothetical protein
LDDEFEYIYEILEQKDQVFDEPNELLEELILGLKLLMIPL